MSAENFIPIENLVALLNNKEFKCILEVTETETMMPSLRNNVYFFRASAYLGLGDLDAALNEAQSGYEGDSNDLWGIQLIASILQKKRNLDQRIAFLEEAKLRTPNHLSEIEALIEIESDTHSEQSVNQNDISEKSQGVIIKQLSQLLNEKKFDEVISEIDAIESSANFSEISTDLTLFRAAVLIERKEFSKARELLLRAIKQNAANVWCVHLLTTCHLELEETQSAIKCLQDFISLETQDVDEARIRLADIFQDMGDIFSAIKTNEERKLIKGLCKKKEKCIVIQCFSKPDSLQQTFDALLDCEGKENFDILIIQDAPPIEDEIRIRSCQFVKNIISKYFPKLSNAFGGVQIVNNIENTGTGPTCRKALDIVCKQYKSFLFIEDDCILTRDGLIWANYHLENSISPQSYWFAALESYLFDCREKELVPKIKERFEFLETNPIASGIYFPIHYVTSTCFATTAEIWGMVSKVRSLPRGANALNAFVDTLPKPVLMPLVPRAHDIGMLHPLGYSVAMVGNQNVSEIKSPYLSSKRLELPEKMKEIQMDEPALELASVFLDEDYIEDAISFLARSGVIE